MTPETTLYICVGVAVIAALSFIVQIGVLVFINMKTHAMLEFKASMKREPIALFFDDNKYVEWKNEKTDAGMIEDKQHGYFMIDATYIDAKTKNVYIPYNTAFAVSLNVKSAKLADDLRFVLKNQDHFTNLKQGILNDEIGENEGIKTLRTTVNFSSIKHLVSPLLPHNVKSKVIGTVRLRLKDSGMSNMPNIALGIVAAIGAMVLGGIMIKLMM